MAELEKRKRTIEKGIKVPGVLAIRFDEENEVVFFFPVSMRGKKMPLSEFQKKYPGDRVDEITVGKKGKNLHS